MRSTVFSELHKLYPERINNKTNGITFRRWLYQANPQLTGMLVDALGADILDKPEQRLIELEPFAEKQAFRKAFAEQRLHSKRALAEIIHERLGIAVNPAAMFDVQVKRIHEYKRQLLNLLHHRGAVPGDPCRARDRLGAASEDLRRQGGGELSPRPS